MPRNDRLTWRDWCTFRQHPPRAVGGGWLHRRPEPAFCAAKKRPKPLLSSKTQEETAMGLEDRDWYREEHRQKRRAEYTQPPPPPPPRAPPVRPTTRTTRATQPPPDLSVYIDAFEKDKRLNFLKWFLFFLVLCFAIYGALAIVRDFKQKAVAKHQQTAPIQQPNKHIQEQPPPQPPQPQKPQPRYL